MTEQDRRRWDELYARLGSAPLDGVRAPALVAPYEDLIPTEGYAIDIACGRGFGAVWLAKHGLDVWGLDISGVAIAQARDLAQRSGVGERCRFDAVDLDEGVPTGPPVDLILCNKFRDPRLNGTLIQRLVPGGLLAIATLSQVDSAPGQFRATPGELITAFAELTVIAAAEGDGKTWLLARR